MNGQCVICDAFVCSKCGRDIEKGAEILHNGLLYCYSCYNNKVVHFWIDYLNQEAAQWIKPNVFRRGLDCRW